MQELADDAPRVDVRGHGAGSLAMREAAGELSFDGEVERGG
jgi:hypothetical protein